MSKQHEKPYNRIQALEATQERGVQLGRIDFSGDWQDRVDPSDLPLEDSETPRRSNHISPGTIEAQDTAMKSIINKRRRQQD